MGIEAQRKKYLFFFFVCFPFTFLEKDHAIYCPEPLWNMTSLDLIGDSLRSGREAWLFSLHGRSRFNLQMTWTPLRHFHRALGGAGKVDDLPRNGSVLGLPLVKARWSHYRYQCGPQWEQMENLGCIWLFLCFPRISWAHPSLCLFAPPWGRN